jgi:hypothetical protein
MTTYMADVTCGDVFCDNNLFRFFVFSMMTRCDGRTGNVASSRILPSPLSDTVYACFFPPFRVRLKTRDEPTMPWVGCAVLSLFLSASTEQVSVAMGAQERYIVMDAAMGFP